MAAAKTDPEAKKERSHLYVIKKSEGYNSFTYDIYDKKPVRHESRLMVRADGGEWKSEGPINSRLTGNCIHRLCNAAGKHFGNLKVGVIYRITSSVKPIEVIKADAKDKKKKK